MALAGVDTFGRGIGGCKPYVPSERDVPVGATDAGALGATDAVALDCAVGVEIRYSIGPGPYRSSVGSVFTFCQLEVTRRVFLDDGRRSATKLSKT